MLKEKIKNIRFDNYVFLIGIILLPFENFFFAPSNGWATLSPILFFIYVFLNIKKVPEIIKKYKEIFIIGVIGIIFTIINYAVSVFNLTNSINAMISLALGVTNLLSFAIYYNKTGETDKIIRLLLYSYSICICIGIIQWITIKFDISQLYNFFNMIFKRNYLKYNRIQFFFTEPSFIGMHLFGILLPMYFVTKNKRLLILTCVFSILALFFGSGVRIVLDAIVIFAIISFSYLIKNKKYIYLFLVLISCIVATLTAYKTNYRIRKIIDEGIYADGSLASRYFRINSSVKGYKYSIGNFIFGYGMGNSLIPIRAGYNEAVMEYKSNYIKEVNELGDLNFNDDSVSYCFYIRFISEFGVVLFLMLIALIIYLYRKSTFKYKLELLLIILYLYLQFESYAFYSLWLMIVIFKESINHKSNYKYNKTKQRCFNEKE